ncbi:MAG: hypothetical protein PUB37_04065 [Firmicutes bacterium]|nr:hypothetical protein [Bacillota bacterium]
MRKTSFSGSLIAVWLLNLLLNLQWSIPAWILLILHFQFGWSIWFFWAALAAWILFTLIFTLFIRQANRCSNTPDSPKQNKNPYSAKNNDVFPPKQ